MNFNVEQKTNFSLKWDYVITVNTKYNIKSKPNIIIIISYYVNDIKYPIKNILHMKRFVGDIILLDRSIDSLQQFIQNIKNKKSAKYGCIAWVSDTNTWYIKQRKHEYLREYGINYSDLILKLNLPSLNQFVSELQSLLSFNKLIIYKQNTLNPSIRNRIKK